MKVKELMSASDIKYCTLDARLSTVVRVMRLSNRGALPVVDNNQKVIGIITDRDIALAVERGNAVPFLSVADVIGHAKVHTVSADQPLEAALSEMRRYKIGRLPVTDKQGKLKGMLTINNIISHALEHPGEIGSAASRSESLARTIKAINDRNTSGHHKKRRRMPDEAYLSDFPF